MSANEHVKSVFIAGAAIAFGAAVLVLSLAAVLFGIALLLFVPGSGWLFAVLGIVGLCFGSFFLVRVAIPFLMLVRSGES